MNYLTKECKTENVKNLEYIRNVSVFCEKFEEVSKQFNISIKNKVSKIFSKI